MLGVTSPVLAEHVLELGVVEQGPNGGVDGALEVVRRLARPARLQQHLEVLGGPAGDARPNASHNSVLPLRGVAQIKYDITGSFPRPESAFSIPPPIARFFSFSTLADIFPQPRSIYTLTTKQIYL